ncbi:MAG TPA: MrpF/PhaF family protein [Solirubrobacteraceae bacterium]|jgi:multisubunit Na+/H+ antiporter MnhF subunit|nr:MrpF/PhaF family protein [Solirubrobacteraceae bacterium]
MNAWLIAALALLPALLVCGVTCFFSAAIDGLVALELASTLSVVELMLLSEGTGRQPFIDLALVLAAMGLIGSVAFARLMEGGP